RRRFFCSDSGAPPARQASAERGGGREGGADLGKGAPGGPPAALAHLGRSVEVQYADLWHVDEDQRLGGLLPEPARGDALLGDPRGVDHDLDQSEGRLARVLGLRILLAGARLGGRSEIGQGAPGEPPRPAPPWRTGASRRERN